MVAYCVGIDGTSGGWAGGATGGWAGGATGGWVGGATATWIVTLPWVGFAAVRASETWNVIVRGPAG